MDIVDELAETPVADSNGTVASNNMPVIASITIDGDFDFPKPDMM